MGGGGTLISLVRFVTFFQRGGFILRPSFSQDCNCWKYTLHLFGAWSSNRPLKDRTGFLPVLHTVRYFCETFIQPVRVSFLHNYRTVLLNSIPYGTSSKPSFSPYGFHFYTTTVRSFECNTPKEYTVRYNTSLSPTRGGGSSPSGSIPRPSPLVTRARMCSHSLTISNLTLPRCHGNFRVSKSFESRTVVRYLHCTGFLSYRTGFS